MHKTYISDRWPIVTGVSGSTENDECKLLLDGSTLNASSIIVKIRRIFRRDSGVYNESKWIYNFDMTKMNNDIDVTFLEKFQYSLSKEVKSNGDVDFRTSFQMENQTIVPNSVSVVFTGINMAVAPAMADVRFKVDDQGPTDGRVSFQTVKSSYGISSNVTIDSSLCQQTGGTRGFMYVSATFQVGSYLTITLGNEVGREMYELYSHSLFPSGTFAILKPEPGQQIYLTPGKKNIIPCLTIGAHLFNYAMPKLWKLAGDGTWGEAYYTRKRWNMGLYLREDSAMIGPDNVRDYVGTYACVLDYDLSTDRHNNSVTQGYIQRQIRREFDVTLS